MKRLYINSSGEYLDTIEFTSEYAETRLKLASSNVDGLNIYNDFGEPDSSYEDPTDIDELLFCSDGSNLEGIVYDVTADTALNGVGQIMGLLSANRTSPVAIDSAGTLLCLDIDGWQAASTSTATKCKLETKLANRHMAVYVSK